MADTSAQSIGWIGFRGTLGHNIKEGACIDYDNVIVIVLVLIDFYITLAYTLGGGMLRF